MNNIIKTTIIIFSLMVLSSCQTWTALQDDLVGLTSKNLHTARAVKGQAETLLASPCPQIKIIDELSSLSDFKNPKSPKENQLISRVDILKAQSKCKLSSKSAVIDLKLTFKGTLGTKGRIRNSDKPFFSYPFFIAITSPSGEIMAKEIFAASLTYGSGENEHIYFENLRQIIPIKSKDIAKYYKILVGFQLTSDQLAYNRENMVTITDNIVEKASLVKKKITSAIIGDIANKNKEIIKPKLKPKPPTNQDK